MTKEQKEGFKRCLKQVCSANAFSSPAAAPASVPQWGAFLALGAELVICGRKLDRLEATASEMRAQTDGKVTTIACDVRDGPPSTT